MERVSTLNMFALCYDRSMLVLLVHLQELCCLVNWSSEMLLILVGRGAFSSGGKLPQSPLWHNTVRCAHSHCFLFCDVVS